MLISRAKDYRATLIVACNYGIRRPLGTPRAQPQQDIVCTQSNFDNGFQMVNQEIRLACNKI